MNEVAIVVLSDPKGGEEALGRVFNALAVAGELDAAGDMVSVQFNGAGTRWPGKLETPGHPAHELYHSVRHTVVGASCGCATVFGAVDAAERAGLPLLTGNAVPGTPGLAGVRDLMRDGYAVLTF